MFISNAQVLKTLEILSTKHNNILNDFSINYNPSRPGDEFVSAVNALETYNSFKQKYQPSVK